jgi:hypothetical protein
LAVTFWRQWRPSTKAKKMPRFPLIGIAFLVATAGTASSSSVTSPIGEWRGDSICQQKASACNDEKALYRVSQVDGRPDLLAITFAKVVDGRIVVMGTIPDCHFDSGAATIRCEYSRGVWLLKISGNTMEGTLTLPDNNVFRRVTLTRQS